MRFIKVKAKSGEPLNEAADAMAAAAAEIDPARAVDLDLDPEAVHLLFKETWVAWVPPWDRSSSRLLQRSPAMPYSTSGVWYPQLHVLSVGLQQRRRATPSVSALHLRTPASGRITI